MSADVPYALTHENVTANYHVKGLQPKVISSQYRSRGNFFNLLLKCTVVWDWREENKLISDNSTSKK